MKAGAAYIDLFCGPGRCNIEDTDQFLDSGALAACKQARKNGSPFSEVYIGDKDSNLVEICKTRLEALGENVIPLVGPACDSVKLVTERLNYYGLHLAYLDPYSLAPLPFSVIEDLARMKRMDMVIHMSKQDLQRNLGRYLQQEISVLDAFAPGWRSALPSDAQPNAAARSQIVNHWVSLVRKRDMAPSRAVLITGSKNQHLYWLMFVSRSSLADKLWNAVSNLNKQGEMPF